MNQSSGAGGIGGTAPSSETKGVPETVGGGGDDASVMQTPIRTLDDMKNLLIQHYGQEQGNKLYQSFLKSVIMMMFSQMQESAEHAKQAAQKMRVDAGLQ
jgi:hypothetical protein